ncbi:serine/threonine protein kinase [Aphanomyces astaci]|uniref:Serine/threonine protein kinase n=1 Tax=Aphanomyces astaci TaxID=112090 RepID=W4FM80_APHAT|nr:serine/threonine protein kinase [Aphanomyces astaci]ETV67934.1 serine/threonine protein kinase [Aphanomyces astaci]|eukprot:XP_009842497.1 serine/threonine protein kinase [Aphanomyces astaci]
MSSGNLDGVLVPIERPEYENQGSMELGVMVGITLGIVLGIVGMVAYWCRLVYVSENAPEQRRGTNPRAVQAPFSSCLLHVMGQQGSIMPVETTEWMLEYRPSVPLDWHDLEAYRLDIALVERTTRLATGGFGSVWLGRFNQQQVAVKSMVEGRIRTSGSVQRFINEVTLMAKLQHPNVVRFIGACWHSLDAVHLVVEYMNLGDLKDHLDIHVAMPWSRKVQCAHDVAAALVYLHDQNIIHRDLKSRNVLLDTHKPSKLSDFGISRELVSRTMSHEVGTFMWAAPEVLKGGQLTVAADIYSFGMLLSELDTHKVPFDGMTTEFGDVMVPMAVVMKIMQGQIKVAPSSSCPPPIALLLNDCTQFDPMLRPTAVELLHRLQQMDVARL